MTAARATGFDLEAPRPEDEGLASIAEQVSRVPTEPGCYLWKDAHDEVIYVGKAKNLRARMRQYVTLQDDRDKIPLMMQVVRSFDYVVVGSEHEALVLERNLIEQYHPYFNVDYKDDKSYPYIAVTESDAYPAIKYTREKHRKGTRYFGPYTDAKAARETINQLRKCVPICIGTCAEWKRAKRYLDAHPDDVAVANLVLAERGRPCFDHHVGRGPGACCGAITTADYGRHVRQVEQFLEGRRSVIIDDLREQMTDAAAEDIVAEAYLLAARSFHRYDPKLALFSTWVIRIAINCMASHYRKEHPLASLDDLPEWSSSQIDEQAVVDDRELVNQLLGELDERDRILVLMKYRDGKRKIRQQDRDAESL